MADPRVQQAVVTVVFEETGEEREVRGLCSVCYPNFLTREEKKDEMRDARIVSARGIAHHSDGYDRTYCGKDATGDKWWWRL